MITRLEPAAGQIGSPLGLASPVVKLAVAVGWLIGLALTTAIAPPLILTAVALLAGLTLGHIPLRTLARSLAPLWLAGLSIGVFNALFSGSNADLSLAEVARLGPFRITEPALVTGAGLAARVVAIVAVGVVFAQTTDPTRLIDSLVQQARLSERFAYGALAAYGAIPRFADDLTSLRQARRIRGLRSSWHPRLLLGLLVLAIRHGDRMAIAMDARAFGSGPRSRFREVGWSWRDPLLAVGAGVILVAVLLLLG